jgi:hypothetical protein
MATFVLMSSTGAKTLVHELWDGQRLRSGRELPLSLSVQSGPVTNPLQIPGLALAAAGDGRSHAVVLPERLGAFLLRHRDGHFVGHGVARDFWVIDRHLGARGEGQARRVLWDACHHGRLFDTQILDLLLQLGTGKFRHAPAAKSGEAEPVPAGLAEVAADYTSLRLPPGDDHGASVGLTGNTPCVGGASVEPRLAEPAARAAAAIWRLYPALAHEAYRLMVASGFDTKARRYDVRPDALEKFGYLSEVIQVKASVVLTYLYRRGMRVDLAQAQALGARYRAELAEVSAALERDYPQVLTYSREGVLETTPKVGAPSLRPDKLAPLLSRVAHEIRAGGHDFLVPTGDGGDQAISCAARKWERCAPLHPFLGLWRRLGRATKRLEFLAGVTAPVLHGEYALLTRTGRTSCAAPAAAGVPGLNLQQVPRDPECRALFLAAPDRRLFAGDFAAAELRTLAAVCRARYGRSRLGDVLGGGADPHAFTAAAVRGVSPADLARLRDEAPGEFEEARQAAKPINHGVPGGLRAKALTAYAWQRYGVRLTARQAADFRRRLIDEVYPELNERDGYLADDGLAALARNLGVTADEVWGTFDPGGRRSPLAARGVANVVRGTSGAGEEYRAAVWGGLSRLARHARGLGPEVAGMIAGEQGCQRLHDRLFWRSAVTLTGRVRAGVSYTQSKNTPSQGLAADGAKQALWDLLYAGFDVCGFVHDEVLVELPAAGAAGKAREVERVMARSMEEVMGQGVPAACKYAVAGCWAKP